MREGRIKKKWCFIIILLFVISGIVPSTSGSDRRTIYVDNDSECPGNGAQE